MTRYFGNKTVGVGYKDENYSVFISSEKDAVYVGSYKDCCDYVDKMEEEYINSLF